MDKRYNFVAVYPNGVPEGFDNYEDARNHMWRRVTCWAMLEHQLIAIEDALTAGNSYHYESSMPDCSPIAAGLFRNVDMAPLSFFINRHLDPWPRSVKYVKEAKAAWDAREGPRVGDMCFRPSVTEDGPFRKRESRFTYAWDETIQSGGGKGSYHMYTSGGVSYSGGLDPGVARDKLRLMPDVHRYGEFWFFKDGWSGAHRGVSFQLPIRTYEEVA